MSRFSMAFALLWLALPVAAAGSDTLHVRIISQETSHPLAGATVQSGTAGAAADARGYARLTTLPRGPVRLTVRAVGHITRDLETTLPSPDTLLITLEPAEEELETITVLSTRSTRTVADIPTRIEVIAGEELDEKSTMKPGEIRMLLNESTGIQTLQTGGLNGASSLRIQGLDGRYTLLLKDGIPWFNGAAGPMSLIQIPPLDLAQVEVIKGSSSTLHGSGAIAGTVNLISRTPGDAPETRLMTNFTSARGADLSLFDSRPYNERTGHTVMASYNRSERYDPGNHGFSAIPQFERFSVAPRFFYSDDERLSVNGGLEAAGESRTGNARFENLTLRQQNSTRRLAARAAADWAAGPATSIQVKSAWSSYHLDRQTTWVNGAETTPIRRFTGTQQFGFAEASLRHAPAGRGEWIAGGAIWTDCFNQDQTDISSYRTTVAGLFVQTTQRLAPAVDVEGGLRMDRAGDFGTVLLPRVSFIFRPADEVTSRIGGGLGYRVPSFFTEDAERVDYLAEAPDPARIPLERSRGLQADLNWRTSLFEGGLVINLNQLVFYTAIDRLHELPQRSVGNPPRYLYEPDPDTRAVSAGAETNLKIEAGDFQAFAGYTFTRARLSSNGSSSPYPLAPAHRVNAFLMYEVEDRFRSGLEAYYTGRQELPLGGTGRPFLILGWMSQRYFDGFSVYLNFENFTDRRQTRLDPSFVPVLSTPPGFGRPDIYAPLDGFLINAGVIVEL